MADLPESIEMIVGRVLHEARERYTSTAGTAGAEGVSTLLKGIVQEYEERLGSDPATASLTPLAHVFGRRKWIDAEIRLRKWAGTSVRQARQDAQRLVGQFSASASALGETPLGIERTWSVPSLRLVGRPDLARLADDGAIEIIDYKSGNIFDRDGIHQSIVTQLKLYALMANFITGRNIRLFVHARQNVAIEWNELEKAKLSERVESLSNGYVAGIVMPATAVSSPGTHCIGCRLRAQCPRYLREMPDFWPNNGENPRPLPLDAWGVVRDQVRDSRGWTLNLDDPAGRQVVISGIDERHGIHEGRLGRNVYAFALAGGEDRLMHGRSLHPRAFHEHSPSPRWESSPCPTFYGLGF